MKNLASLVRYNVWYSIYDSVGDDLDGVVGCASNARVTTRASLLLKGSTNKPMAAIRNNVNAALPEKLNEK